jgi:vancomycin permeability regulator SanA
MKKFWSWMFLIVMVLLIPGLATASVNYDAIYFSEQAVTQSAVMSQNIGVNYDAIKWVDALQKTGRFFNKDTIVNADSIFYFDTAVFTEDSLEIGTAFTVAQVNNIKQGAFNNC